MAIIKSSGAKLSSRYSFLLISILGLAGIICFYYFLFLTGRETMLDKRYFRIMQRMETNITKTVEAHKNLVDGHAFSAKNVLNHNQTFSTIQYEVTQEAIDELRNAPSAPWANKTQTGLNFNRIQFVDTLESDSGKMVAGPRLVYNPQEDSVFRIMQNIPAKNGTVKLQFQFTVGNLINSLLRKDAIDEMLLVKNGRIIYETFPSGLELGKSDSIFTSSGDTKSGVIKTILCGGIKYRAYPQKLTIGDIDGWTLIGLKSADSFTAEKHAIPRNYLFAVFLLVLFSILALPFVKSLIMSRTERLNTLDVILSCTSMVTTISIITLLLFGGYLYFTVDKPIADHQLTELSGNIRKDLLNEITSISKEINRYDSCVSKNCAGSPEQCDSFKNNYKPIFYKKYTNLFMVNRAGKTIYDQKDQHYSLDVSNRRYFKKILSGEYWYLPNTQEPFYLDAVISWRDGKCRSIVSKPVKFSGKMSEKPEVIAMSTDLQSLSKTIIPNDFGFCIFDAEGNVIIHSDKSKSLNENFLEENDNDPTLQAAMYGRSGSLIDLNYSGEPVRAYICPLKKMPFYLAVFSKSSVIDSQHGQIFGVSLTMQTLALLIYFLLAFISHLSMSYKSRLSIPRFSFAFFLPKERDNENYNRALLFNFLHGICLLAFTTVPGHPIFILYLLFTAPLFSIIFNYHLLDKKNFFVLKKYNRVVKRNMLSFIFLLLLVNFTAWFNIDHLGLFLLWQFIVGCIYFVCVKLNYQKFFIVDYRKSYFLLIYFIILTSCVIPVIRFTGIAFNKEKEISVKLSQLDMAREYGIDSAKYHVGNFNDTTQPGNYASCFNATRITRDTSGFTAMTREEHLFENYSSRLRSIIQGSGRYSRFLGMGANDTSWIWSHDGNQLAMTVSLPFMMPQTLGKQATISSVLPHFRFPGFFGINESGTEFWSALYFWFILLFLLYVLFRVLCFFVRRLFAPEAFDGDNFPELDHEFFKESQPESRIFITGLPRSGKSAYFLDLYKDDKPFQLVNLLTCTNEEEWKKETDNALCLKDGVILIDHFEYDCLNHETNDKKLDLLEKLSLRQDNRVIVVSAIHPQAFLELYTTPGVIESPENKIQNGTSERWNKAFSSFCHLFYPIQGYKKDCENKLRKYADLLPEPLSNLIISECKHGNFLCNIGEELFLGLAKEKKQYPLSNADEERVMREDVVLKIQKLSHMYYLAVWSSLTKEEQYVLFDLAQDGVVNSKNMDVMTLLVDKGLVVHYEELLPMNMSFRNFILSVIEPADMMKMEQNVRDSGNWNKWRMPLFIFVCALVFFVLQTDQNEIVTYITAFAAGLPFIINLFSSFKKTVGGKGE